MKIKRIGQFCKEEKQTIVFDVPDSEGIITQWIGDGHALYPIYNLPHMDRDALYTIWGIEKKKWQDIAFHIVPEAPEGLNLKDTDWDERPVNRGRLAISAQGRILLPLQTRKDIVFIDHKYITPLSDMMQTLELYERTTPSGGTYIAIKVAMLLYGIVMPHPIINEDFVKEMNYLTTLCRTAYSKNKARQEAAASDAPVQVTIQVGDEQVDADTGEIVEG